MVLTSALRDIVRNFLPIGTAYHDISDEFGIARSDTLKFRSFQSMKYQTTK